MIPQFIANRFQYTIMQIPFVEEDRVFFREQKLEPMQKAIFDIAMYNPLAIDFVDDSSYMYRQGFSMHF